MSSAITLTRYEDLREAYRARDLRQATYDEGAIIMAECLLDLHGPEHRDRRRLENRLFRRETFRYYERDVIPPRIDEVLAPAVQRGTGDLLQIGRRTIMNLTAEIAGIDRVRGSAEETEDLYRFSVKFSEGATLVHSARDKEVVRAEVREAFAAWDELFYQPSLRRRQQLVARCDAGEIDESALPVDVLTTLVRNQDKLELPPEVVRREVAFYLQAGSHSTSNAFTHTMNELFGWFERAPEGSDAARARVRDDRVFAQRCFHEALRLHPASPVAWRRALAPVSLKTGVEVPEGALVILDLMAANRDVTAWGANAAEFDPTRVVPPGIPPWGHSFGGGVHACIGMELDGGVEPDPAGAFDPSEHLMGTVALLVEAMLRHGARPDPSDPPVVDTGSTRFNFSAYPVEFDPVLAAAAR